MKGEKSRGSVDKPHPDVKRMRLEVGFASPAVADFLIAAAGDLQYNRHNREKRCLSFPLRQRVKCGSCRGSASKCGA